MEEALSRERDAVTVMSSSNSRTFKRPTGHSGTRLIRASTPRGLPPAWVRSPRFNLLPLRRNFFFAANTSMHFPTPSRNRFSLMLNLHSFSKTSDASASKAKHSSPLSGQPEAAVSAVATNCDTVVHSPLPSSPKAAAGDSASSTPRSAASSSTVSTSRRATRVEDSPRSTVVHSSTVPVSPGLPLPSTTNKLDAREKMRLLKKARKLSRVFGEVPVGMPTENQADIALDAADSNKSVHLKRMSWGPAQFQSAMSGSPTAERLTFTVPPSPQPAVDPEASTLLSHDADQNSLVSLASVLPPSTGFREGSSRPSGQTQPTSRRERSL
ncbi:hypothetical protein EW146_g1084 [Bondarzewia mesenterica]|uniref:Uncharacterized protein n=1 Tax=Bondarzewia mesenterica TaxID=1095465 RepID=A0A4S4M758_9AGAM|nr:hypothetical protein EW146_g1084 [Bondarzewia mesenterica]